MTKTQKQQYAQRVATRKRNAAKKATGGRTTSIPLSAIGPRPTPRVTGTSTTGALTRRVAFLEREAVALRALVAVYVGGGGARP